MNNCGKESKENEEVFEDELDSKYEMLEEENYCDNPSCLKQNCEGNH